MRAKYEALVGSVLQSSEQVEREMAGIEAQVDFWSPERGAVRAVTEISDDALAFQERGERGGMYSSSSAGCLEGVGSIGVEAAVGSAGGFHRGGLASASATSIGLGGGNSKPPWNVDGIRGHGPHLRSSFPQQPGSSPRPATSSRDSKTSFVTATSTKQTSSKIKAPYSARSPPGAARRMLRSTDEGAIPPSALEMAGYEAAAASSNIDELKEVIQRLERRIQKFEASANISSSSSTTTYVPAFPFSPRVRGEVLRKMKTGLLKLMRRQQSLIVQAREKAMQDFD